MGWAKTDAGHVNIGRLFIAWYDWRRWLYFRVFVRDFGTKRADGRTRYIWAAVGPIDLRWAL